MLKQLAELIEGPEGRLEASELAPLVVVMAIVAGGLSLHGLRPIPTGWIELLVPVLGWHGATKGLSLHAQSVAGRPASASKKEGEPA